MRPQVAASRLAARATGTITTWAAMMQADIKTAAPSFMPSLDFCPTSGSIAALAKWNRTTEAAKIAIRRSLNSSTIPMASWSFPSPSSAPRASSWSMSCSRISRTADGAGGRHAGDDEEQGPVAEQVGSPAREGRRDDVAAVIERLVPARLSRHRRPADQAQRQGRHGGREDRRRRPDRRLSGDDDRERRHQIDHDAARRRRSPPRSRPPGVSTGCGRSGLRPGSGPAPSRSATRPARSRPGPRPSGDALAGTCPGMAPSRPARPRGRRSGRRAPGCSSGDGFRSGESGPVVSLLDIMKFSRDQSIQ